MTSSPGLLNFFVLEASEYVEQLDQALAAAGTSAPRDEAFTRSARALRGSATMAKLNGLAALAASVERIGRALQQSALRWDPALHGALTAAVDDLRLLVRSVRAWSPAEEQRAQARTAELLGFVPMGARAASPTPVAPPSGGAMYVVTGTAEAAAALAAAAARPGERELLAGAVRRIRALRGVAALRDHATIAEALDPIERTAQRALDDGTLGGPRQAFLAAAARHLRRASEDVRAGRPASPDAPEARAFHATAQALVTPVAQPPRVVAVSELFSDAPGPHLIHEAAAPPERAWNRFRLEAVGQAEHLRRLAADARRATGEAEQRRTAAALHAAVTRLADDARSYGQPELARAILEASSGAAERSALALTAVDLAAALFVDAERTPAELVHRLDELTGARSFAAVAATGFQPVPARRGTPLGGRAVTPPRTGTPVRGATPTRPGPTVPPPRATPARPTPAVAVAGPPRPSRPSMPTPTGQELHSLLASSIAGIRRLDTEPLDDAAVDVLPIEELQYRGRAALDRARAVRDEIRQRGGAPDPAALAELFELLDLAAES
ncbi:MAG TPA: Hpt domain-containing protein [Gemmatimonadaceae bacterium]|nr:Hpt domain-containing protein [Gemmatimonadaceae bacterium]